MEQELEEVAEEIAGEVVSKEFHIDSRSSADWLLRKLALLEMEEKLIKEQTKGMLELLQRDRQRLTARFGAELEHWAATELATARRKSLTLPHGTIGFRTVNGRLKVSDPASALAYALMCGKADQLTKRELLAEQYREWAQSQLDTEGELLPGVEMTDTRESFSIKFGGKE